jgi:hypothetical protein
MNKFKFMKAEVSNQIFGIQRKEDSSNINKSSLYGNPKRDEERIIYYEIGNNKKRPRNRLHLVRESNYKEGRWDSEEHQKFVKSCIIYGNNWRKVIIIFQTNMYILFSGPKRNKNEKLSSNQISRSKIRDSIVSKIFYHDK